MDDLFGSAADSAPSAFDSLVVSDVALESLPVEGDGGGWDVGPAGAEVNGAGGGHAGEAAPAGPLRAPPWARQPPLARLTPDAALADALGGSRLRTFLGAPLRPSISAADARRAAALAQLAAIELLLKREASLSGPAAADDAVRIAELIDAALDAAEEALGGSLAAHVDAHALAGLFPRAAERLGCQTAPGGPSPVSPRGMPGDVGAHLARMNLLNQCAAMAVQLNRDVLGLRNHKYLAHQVALLYQSLSQLAALLPSSPLFSDLQSRIRERFDAVKQQCSAAPPSGSTDPEEAEGPVLSPDLVEWLAGLTRDVVAQVVFGRHGGARLPLEGDGMYDALWS